MLNYVNYLKLLLHYAFCVLRWVIKRKGICVGHTSSPFLTNMMIKF